MAVETCANKPDLTVLHRGRIWHSLLLVTHSFRLYGGLALDHQEPFWQSLISYERISGSSTNTFLASLPALEIGLG